MLDCPKRLMMHANDSSSLGEKWRLNAWSNCFLVYTIRKGSGVYKLSSRIFRIIHAWRRKALLNGFSLCPEWLTYVTMQTSPEIAELELIVPESTSNSLAYAESECTSMTWYYSMDLMCVTTVLYCHESSMSLVGRLWRRKMTSHFCQNIEVRTTSSTFSSLQSKGQKSLLLDQNKKTLPSEKCIRARSMTVLHSWMYWGMVPCLLFECIGIILYWISPKLAKLLFEFSICGQRPPLNWSTTEALRRFLLCYVIRGMRNINIGTACIEEDDLKAILSLFKYSIKLL